MDKLFKQIADSKLFQNIVTIAILVAGLLVGMATYSNFAAKHTDVLSVLNRVILGIFIIEIVVVMGSFGRKFWLYFGDAWNVFDFLIVVAALLPFGGSSVAVLRLLRLLRVLKLIKALPKLQMLVGALLKSIPSMGYVSLLLLLLFYIYAVAGVIFFGANDPVHFGDLETSMLSLFRIVTLEDWTDIMYINMHGCANYGYDGMMELCTASKGSPLGSAAFFVSFVLIGTMIILNLFIGVIMTGMEDAKSEMEEADAKEAGPLAVNVAAIENKMVELQELLKTLKEKTA